MKHGPKFRAAGALVAAQGRAWTFARAMEELDGPAWGRALAGRTAALRSITLARRLCRLPAHVRRPLP